MHSFLTTQHRRTPRRSPIALALYAALGIAPTLHAVPSAPVGPEFQVNTFTTGTQRLPATAMDADGDFVIVWESRYEEGGTQYDIHAQRYNAAGVAQGTEFRVNTFTTRSQSSV